MSRDYAKKPRSGGSAATTSRPAPKTRKGRSATKGPARRKPELKKSAAPRNQSGGLSLRWILSLALVGGFVGFIVYLNAMPVPDNSRTTDSQARTQKPQKTQPAAPVKKKEEKQSFQFYEMLPKSEVVPPKVEEYDPGPSAAQRAYRYVVQTGSFKGKSDAERQRAQVAFQGLHASIEEIELDSGTIWYRVNVGPFESRSKMNSVVDKLVSINIEPLVRKVPKDG